MQGNNWQFLILLAIAVVIYALVQARKKPSDDDEGGEGADAPEGKAAPDTKPPEPKSAEVSWAECQEQLSEAPPLSECDEVDSAAPDEIEEAPEGGTRDAQWETEVEPVPPPRVSINAAIRARAWGLFRENYRKILPLSGVVVLWMVLKTLIQKTGLLPGGLMGVVGPIDLLTVLVAPVVTLGASYAAVRLWDGEAPRPGMLFHFLKGRRYFPALGLMLLKALVQLLPSLMLLGVSFLIGRVFFSASQEIPPNAVWAIYLLSIIETLFALVATVWLAAWLQVASFSYAYAPERGVMAAFRAGFRAGTRKFGLWMGMVIAAGWPLGAVSLLGYFVSFWGPAMRSPLTSQVSVILFLLLTLFYGGYVMIAMAGLAARLCPEKGAPMADGEAAGANAGEADGEAAGANAGEADGEAAGANAGEADGEAAGTNAGEADAEADTEG